MEQKTRFTIPGQVEYENMLLADDHTVEALQRVVNLELEPTDMVVASYPKTGTTVLQEIVWLLRNDADVAGAEKIPNVARVPYIDLGLQDSLAMFSALPHPRTMKTHVPYKLLPKGALDGKNKVICPFRNPKDTLVSFYHFHRMYSGLGNFTGSWDDFFDYFVESGDKLLYGNPVDHMLGYWEHRQDDNMLIVFYEDIVTKRLQVVKEIAEFIGVALSDEQLKKVCEATSFDTMKKSPMTNMGEEEPTNSVTDQFKVLNHEISPFMRKGQIGDWKNYFSEEQSRYVDDMTERKLTGTGLTFIYA